ncbi:MAG TPA: hypothetical protein VMV72_12385 [Verrucomicrobiae bacterium]|nr:hypothetical protein [Verrucomicrobiae bacterium]
MIAPLAKVIDWSALQMAYVVAPLRRAPRPKWKLEEALEFLNGPDFIPAASDPAQIEFDGPRDFKFPTPCPSEDQENNIVYGRLYRCEELWQKWQQPEIWRLPHGHASGQLRLGLMGRVLRWLSPRLSKPAVTKGRPRERAANSGSVES